MRYTLLLAGLVVGSTMAAMAQPPEPPAALPTDADVAEPSADEAMTLRRSAAQEIASAYGLEGWDQIERIEFTFNVQAGDRRVQRHWTWDIAAGEVTREQEDSEPVSFPVADGSIMLPVGVELSGESAKAHRQFVNDSYWFLFPFQIVWSDPQVTDHGDTPLPIGDGEARKVTVQYAGKGGYTPGDAYDLFVDDNGRIVQWVFRRGGKAEGSAVTWDAHHELGPIVVSLEHGHPDRDFRLWFSEVRAVVADEDGQTAEHEPVPIQQD